MKKCTYCGKEYPDEAEFCAVDQEPLQSDAPTPTTDPAIDVVLPDDYICIGHFDPIDAARLLGQFESEGIRFLIDRVEKRLETARGIRKQDLIEIDVHYEDEKRASTILSRDWKI